MFHDIANINDAVVEQNTDLLFGKLNGIALPKELWTFVMANLGWLYAGLALNMVSDMWNPPFVVDTRFMVRAQMDDYGDFRMYDHTEEYHKFLMDDLDEKTAHRFNQKLRRELARMKPYDEAITECVRKLTDEDRDSIGYVVSNYVYILKLLAFDREFEQYFRNFIVMTHAMFMADAA